MITKLTTMIANKVGMISAMRRIAYAIMRGSSRSLLRHFAFLSLDRLIGGGIDPPGLEPDRVSGRDGGAPELVPMGDTECRNVVIRDDVIAILQYPVEGVRVGHEACAVGRTNQF